MEAHRLDSTSWSLRPWYLRPLSRKRSCRLQGMNSSHDLDWLRLKVNSSSNFQGSSSLASMTIW